MLVGTYLSTKPEAACFYGCPGVKVHGRIVTNQPRSRRPLDGFGQSSPRPQPHPISLHSNSIGMPLFDVVEPQPASAFAATNRPPPADP